MTNPKGRNPGNHERIDPSEPSPPCPVCGSGHLRIPRICYDEFQRIWWQHERYEQNEDDTVFPAFVNAMLCDYLHDHRGLEYEWFRPYAHDPAAELVEISAWPRLEAEVRALAFEENRTIEDVSAELAWFGVQIAGARAE